MICTVDGSDLGDGFEIRENWLEIDQFSDFIDLQQFALPEGVDVLLGIDFLARYRVELNHDPLAQERVKMHCLRDDFEGETASTTDYELKSLATINLVESSAPTTPHQANGLYVPQTLSCGMVSSAPNSIDNSIELLSHRAHKKLKKKDFA